MSEIKVVARHAGSVWVGQLASMAFMVTDTLVAGRHSQDALAALSVGTAVYVSVFIALVMMVQALLPIWSELQGAKRFVELGRSVRQSLYLAALVATVGLVILIYPTPLFRITQVPDHILAGTERYLSILSYSFVPSLLFRMYSTLNQSLGRPLLVTWLQLGALVIKIPLTICLALGGLGFPAMGAVGCAWATVIVYWAMFGLAIVMLRTQPLYRPYELWSALERPDWKTLGKFARLGVPTGLTVLVEVTSFTMMALFIARMGTVASAAHQIVSNVVAVMYMLPLSLGIAISARASFWLGANEPIQAKRVVRHGFILVAVSAIFFASVVFLFRGALAYAYTEDLQVQALAASLLTWIALFHLADAIQAVSGIVLRSYRVAIAPLVIYSTLLWGGGLGGACVWAYSGLPSLAARPEPSTFWITSTAALMVSAIALAALLFWTMSRTATGSSGNE